MRVPERQHARVVGIQQRHARARQRLDQLALGCGYALDGVEILGVRVPHVGHHSHLRLGDGGQPADLARVIHSDFENRRAAAVLERQDGERHPHVIIEIPGRLPHGELHCQ